MKKSEFKNIVREITRNKFYESLNEAPTIGKDELTKKKLSPKDIMSVAKQYVDYPITRATKKRDMIIRVANDLSKLIGKKQADPKVKSGKPALILQLLKNKMIDKKEYVDLYKNLWAKHIQLIKYLKNVQNVKAMSGSSKAKRAAMKDMN
tara:strand:- start:294 stop:743 length:450 start_codon:yes stop_codon:yes gene_type:complete